MVMLARAGTAGMAAHVTRLTVREIGITLTRHQTDRLREPAGIVRIMGRWKSGT